MVEDAISHTQKAINRIAHALELPGFIQISNQTEVQSFAHQLLSQAAQHQAAVDQALEEAMVTWRLKRLARIDRDILRLAVVEMDYLGYHIGYGWWTQVQRKWKLSSKPG